MFSRQVRYWFGIGNLAVACILATADYALPTKSYWLDVPLAAVALLLWVGGFGILLKQAWAVPVMRLSAVALLTFGLLSLSLVALTAAFLFGVHGQFLRDGVELVVIGFALLVPYALLYPILVLASVKVATGSRR
jgi:hypothetical protein